MAHGDVVKYWNQHTVNSKPFKTAKDSLDYLDWRSKRYPLFEKICLGNKYDKCGENCETLLDYGCGPGNDIVGYANYNKNIKKIWAVDISTKAINLSKIRLNLHGREVRDKVTFIDLNSEPRLNSKNKNFLSEHIDSNSIDYIQSLGVLMHAHTYNNILEEFYRILKAEGKCTTMIYNKDSIWYHLYCGYVLKVLDPVELDEHVIATGAKSVAIKNKGYENVSTDDIFNYCTDGLNCPLSLAFNDKEWNVICSKAGFEVKQIGNYYSDYEVKIFKKYYKKSLKDKRLDKVHRDFLENLELKDDIFYYNGQIAGIGLCHQLKKI